MYPRQLITVVPKAGNPILNTSGIIDVSGFISTNDGRSFSLLNIIASMAIPPMPKLIHEAIAAPRTPSSNLYINTTFSRTFNTFSATLIYIGDLVSFMERIIAAKTLDEVLKTNVILVTEKYKLAGFTISASTPIQTGIYGDKTSASVSRIMPITNA